ncbi:toll/interleukin-1 receptor domain-containing protein [Saccharothrix longispora]|uniref:WD40 repeat protein n=1 Tax=Saccharothrix longispora TaxID=33920 RepID=A0ABU1PSR5_9PSEU|nr:TIR domain-containing protein [Saccharothrix longispora]MDR6593693.1 WD40 repeat protein [Saccharothrix longispora]
MESIEVRRPPGHAFISYVREDTARADRLQRALEAAGVNVWRDTRDLWPGQDWKIEIRRAISADSLVFLACFSEVSEKRQISYQHEELNQAVEQMRMRRPGHPWIIPVRFAECTLPPFDLGAGKSLESLQRIDLFEENWDEGIAQLVRVVVYALESERPSRLLTRRRLLSTTAGAALVYLSSTAAGRSDQLDVPLRNANASHVVELGNLRQWTTDHWGLRGVAAIDFSPDGRLVATGGNETIEGTTRLWSVADRQRVQILTGGAAPVAFSPDGQYLATGTSNSQVRFWDVSSFRSSDALPTDNLMWFAFAPDTDRVVGGSGSGRLETWDVTAPESVGVTTAPHIVDAVVFDADRHVISCGLRTDVSGTRGVVVWDATSAKVLHEFAESSRPTMLSPDGTVLVATRQESVDPEKHVVEVWDVRTEKRVASMLESDYSHSELVVAFRPDGRLFAVGSGRTLQLHNVHVGSGSTTVDEASPAVEIGHGSSRITSIAFNRDGTVLAVGDHEGVLYLWDMRPLSRD